jgi:hypothetical protein
MVFESAVRLARKWVPQMRVALPPVSPVSRVRTWAS